MKPRRETNTVSRKIRRTGGRGRGIGDHQRRAEIPDNRFSPRFEKFRKIRKLNSSDERLIKEEEGGSLFNERLSIRREQVLHCVLLLNIYIYIYSRPLYLQYHHIS